MEVAEAEVVEPAEWVASFPSVQTTLGRKKSPDRWYCCSIDSGVIMVCILRRGGFLCAVCFALLKRSE